MNPVIQWSFTVKNINFTAVKYELECGIEFDIIPTKTCEKRRERIMFGAVA